MRLVQMGSPRYIYYLHIEQIPVLDVSKHSKNIES